MFIIMKDKYVRMSNPVVAPSSSEPIDGTVSSSLIRGNNVLITYRSDTERVRDYLTDLVVDDSIRRKHVLHVSTEESSAELISRWYQRSNRFPEHLAIVSSHDELPPTAEHSRTDTMQRYPHLAPVHDPSDLTEIGTTVSSLLKERWKTSANRTIVDFNCLGAFLAHCDREQLFRFLHILSSRIEQANATCYYGIDVRRCDPASVRLFGELVDEVVCIDTDEVRLLR